jgi:UDP-glucose 4-epimerase
MKTLILGGAGFIGSHLAEALLAQGHEVRIFDRPHIQIPAELEECHGIEWMQGDFLSMADIQAAVDGVELIFHLVSTTLPKNSNDDPGYDVGTNVIGSLHLLDAAVRVGIRKIVFISSGGTIYGIPSQIPIPETHPTDPLVSYGISKLAIEKYLKLYHELHGLDYAVLRVANPYGERQRTDMAQGAVAVFAKKALAGETIEIWGDGSVTRDYIYIADLIEAFVLAASYQGQERIFNIGGGHGLSLNQLLATLEELLARPVNRRFLPARNFDVHVNILDITRAREVLGWAPRTSFKVGLQRTLQWLSSHELAVR